MTHLKRSRRVQAGLAGLSIVGALGAALGLGLTTHTSNAQASQGGSGSQDTSTGSAGTSKGSTSGSTSTNSHASSSSKHQSSPVTPSASPTPQATTSGS